MTTFTDEQGNTVAVGDVLVWTSEGGIPMGTPVVRYGLFAGVDALYAIFPNGKEGPLFAHQVAKMRAMKGRK